MARGWTPWMASRVAAVCRRSWNRCCLFQPASIASTACESDSFRNQWNDIQVSFLDAPSPSVEKADQLIATVVQRLTQIYVEERSKLENEWAKRSEVSTEDLRQALRRYRTFFDRLLSA